MSRPLAPPTPQSGSHRFHRGTIDFVLSGSRDAAAAKRLFRKALSDPSHPQPRVINTDQARLYGSANSGVKRKESCAAAAATGLSDT